MASVIYAKDTQGNDEILLFDIYNKRDAVSQFTAGTNVFRLTKDGYKYTASGWKYRHVQLGLGDLAADSDAFDYPLLRCKHDVTITNVEVGVDTTLAANATNYQTLTLYKSSSTTAVADTLSTASTGFTLHVPRAFASISSTLGILYAGETLYLSPTKGAAGAILSGVVVAISFTINIPETQSGTATDNVMRVINEVGTDGVILLDHTYRDMMIIKREGTEVWRCDIDGIESGTAADQYYYEAANVGTIVDGDGAAKKSALFKPNGTVDIENVYFGVNTTALADDDTNYGQVLIKDDTGDIIVSAFVHGPISGGTARTQGLLYDMGTCDPQHKRISSTEQVQVEYIMNGTTTDIAGLTVVVCYKKVD